MKKESIRDKTCPGCGCFIMRRSFCCQKCVVKLGVLSGRNNPNYKHGKTKNKSKKKVLA